MHHRRSSLNVSLGGMRVYSDEEVRIGQRLELELLLGEGASARCWARIAWVERLDGSIPAAYEVGLEFTDMSDEDRRLLTAALRPI